MAQHFFICALLNGDEIRAPEDIDDNSLFLAQSRGNVKMQKCFIDGIHFWKLHHLKSNQGVATGGKDCQKLEF